MKLLLSLAIIVLALESIVFGHSRIYKGHPIDISEAPYMAYIVYDGYDDSGALDLFQCGGSILKKNFILTAAHCLTDNNDSSHKKKAESYKVRVGSTYVNTGGTVYGISEVITHPFYTLTSRRNDVGILKLSSNIKYDSKNVKNVELSRADESYKAGDRVFTQGWGDNPEHMDALELYRVDLTIVTSTYCRRNWGRQYEENEICVLGRNRADSCEGDSGGPLILKSTGRQIGVISGGAPCAVYKEQLPGIYASIKDNMKWISCVIDGIN